MQKRPSSLTRWLISLAFLASTVTFAENGAAPERQAEWNQRLERALAMQKESAEQQAAAKVLLDESSPGCYKKFLVNACLSNARKAHRQSMNDAKRLENEGKAIERQVKKEQLSDADQRRLAEAQQKDAELQAREAQTSAARQQMADEQAATVADKAKKAVEGAQRKAADAEQLAKKRADHEAKVAAKKEDAARRAAETEAKAASAAK
jgi:colicin import membrane protein